METDHPVLSSDIDQVTTSDEFLEVCHLNGFKTLGDIIQYPADELIKKPGFNIRMMMELYSILKRHHLETLIKE